MPISPPVSYTTFYNLKKYNDLDTPGAAALNEDKDTIDFYIHAASVSATYTSDAPILISSNNISLLYDAINLKLSGSKLTTIQDIATTSSPTFSGLLINGNTVITGKLTAEEFYSEYNSSSVIYSSGSTKFGDTIDDNHQFTGSVLLSGSIGINKIPLYELDINGNVNINESSSYLYEGIQALKLSRGTDSVFANTHVGLNAGNSISTRQTAVGYAAGQSNTGSYQSAFGSFAGSLNIGLNQTAIGYTAGRLNTGDYQTVIGTNAGQLNTGIYEISLGYLAGYNNGGDSIIGIGYEAARNNTADNVIAIGYQSGKGNNTANQFIVKQANINGVPLIQGDFSTGNVIIGGNTASEKLTVIGSISASNNIIASGQISASGTGDNYFVGKTNFGLTKTGPEAVNIYGNVAQSGSYGLYNNFSSGWAGSGWRLDQGISNSGSSKLELDDMTIRGTLNVYQLLINQIRATNGTLIVSSVARVTSSMSSLPFGFHYITFEDPDNFGYSPFLENDIIISQRVQLSGSVLIKRVVRKVVGVNGMTVTASYLSDGPSDTGDTIKGDDFVRIGNTTNNTRQGSIYLTTDDSNSPFQDIINGVASWADWTNKTKLKVRLGNLSGVTSDNFGQLGEYGLYAKGGVYLESSGSQNSIALKVDSASAQLTMKQTGNTIFDFNTETSTAKISGWTFDKEKLYANSLPANYVLQMVGSGSYPYINAGFNDTEANDVQIIIGRIPTGVYSAGQIGLIGYSEFNNAKYFVLTEATKSIAGWNFDGGKLYNATNIVLDGTNKKVSVNNDAVKMYYTNGLDYGITATGFHLGSTNTIAGWTFDTNKLYTGTNIVLDGTNKKVSVNNDAVKMYYTDSTNYGISASGFHLGSTNTIAGWTFDTNKLYTGVSSASIVLNTSTTPFISSVGKGFEVWDLNNPKLFVGSKIGSYLDWNSKSANTLTISGSITGSVILGSRFTTGPFQAWTGENGTYGALYVNSSTNAPILFLEKYSDVNNYVIANYSAYNTPTSYYLYITEVSASVNLATIRIGAGKTATTAYISLDGKQVSKYHGHQSSAPTVNLNAGDTYSSGSGAALKIRMYANGSWILLN